MLPFPDLVLIDGGVGQLESARVALGEVGAGHLPIIGLAKAKGEKEERIYMLGKKQPIVLSSPSPASDLVQRIRDEAHRFAITYHRRLRGNSLILPVSKRRKRPSRSTVNTPKSL